MPMLSVYRDYGVTPRDGRDHNYNKPGQDLAAYRVVRQGELVLNKMKTWQGSLGISDYDGIVSPAYFVARPLTDDNPAFLHHLLRSPPLIAEYGARSKGIRPSQWDLPWDEFRNIVVEIPPLSIQRAIADYLDCETSRIDALMVAKRRMITLLEEQRTLILLQHVAPHLLSHGRVPDDWHTTRLKYLFYPPVAGAWGNEPEGSSLDTLCIRVADFDRRRFRVHERAATLRSVEPTTRHKCLLTTGDVLIEKSGGGEAQPVGFAVVFDLDADAICSNFVARLRPRPDLEPAYGGLILAAAYRAECNVPFVKQTTGIQNLDLPAYLSLPWYVPDRASQVRLCDRLESVFSTIDRINDMLDRQLILLQKRRQALITVAVTGQLDIPEAA
jgi:type I restriction enzyme S subunit